MRVQVRRPAAMPMAGRRVMHAAVGMPGTRIPAAADRRITLGDGDRPGEARRAAVRYNASTAAAIARDAQSRSIWRSAVSCRPGLSTAETAAKLSVCARRPRKRTRAGSWAGSGSAIEYEPSLWPRKAAGARQAGNETCSLSFTVSEDTGERVIRVWTLTLRHSPSSIQAPVTTACAWCSRPSGTGRPPKTWSPRPSRERGFLAQSQQASRAPGVGGAHRAEHPPVVVARHRREVVVAEVDATAAGPAAGPES